MSTPASR